MKKLLSILLLLTMALSTIGCHGSKERNTFEVPENFDTSRNYEISFWAKNDTNMTQVAIYEKTVADFEALYPNIKVNLRLYTDYGKIYNDVITNIATDTTPNVCITYPDHIATYLTGADSVVPLDTLFNHPKYGLGGSDVLFDAPSKEEIVPKFLEECKVNGFHYAVPYMRSTESCYINKTFVEKLGYTLPEILTWDFVWEVSQAATEKNPDGTYKVNGQNVLIPFIYKSTDNMMIQMLKQQEAGYSTNNGTIEIFNDTTKEILYEVAEATKTESFSTFKISGYPGNFLNAGQCIFAVDSTAGASWMGSNAPHIDIAEDKLAHFETAVMTIPQYDPKNPQMISQGPSVCVFNKEDPQEVLASWLFTQFLLTNDVQISYAQTEGYCPVTLKAQNTDIYQDYLSREGEDNQLYYEVKLQATKLLLNNIDNTFVTPVFNGSTSLRDAAGTMIESTTKAIRRKKEVNEAFMADLFEEMTALYHLNEAGSQKAAGGDLGPLPPAAIALLASLGGIWIILGSIFLYDKLKKKS